MLEYISKYIFIPHTFLQIFFPKFLIPEKKVWMRLIEVCGSLWSTAIFESSDEIIILVKFPVTAITVNDGGPWWALRYTWYAYGVH